MKNLYILCLLLLTTILSADARIQYELNIEDGTVTDREMLITQNGNTETLIIASEQGELKLICDENDNTLVYETKSSDDKYSLKARVEDGMIVVHQVMDGNTTQKTLPYDGELPWYQSFDYQFSDFAVSGEKKREFYMIRPDDLSLSKWQLKRKGTETLETPMGEVETIKIKVSLSGMLAMFWSAECWYRASDGCFVKYEGPMGPPGSDTVVTIISKEERF